jgi:hypothetical protein
MRFTSEAEELVSAGYEATAVRSVHVFKGFLGYRVHQNRI